MGFSQRQLEDLISQCEPVADTHEEHVVTGELFPPDCISIKIKGRLVGIDSANKIITRICQLVEDLDQHVILNLRNCPFLSSFVLGEITRVCIARKNRGYQMVIADPNEPVLDVMKLTGMDQILDVYDTQDEALKSLQMAV